ALADVGTQHGGTILFAGAEPLVRVAALNVRLPIRRAGGGPTLARRASRLLAVERNRREDQTDEDRDDRHGQRCERTFHFTPSCSGMRTCSPSLIQPGLT